MIHKRHPQLDGLRTISIAFVMAHHAYVPYFSGGFIGVDIFFVLSGFLISSIITKEIEATGQFDFFRFSIRRATRLLPGLLLMLFLLAGYLWLFNSGDYYSNQYNFLSTLTYSTNWIRAFQLNEPNLYLGHTWSLAVEQQFYFLWPLLVIAALGSNNPVRNIARITTGILAICLIWRCYLITIDISTSRVYFGLDTRVDGIMLGCLAGLILSSRKVFPKLIHINKIVSVFRIPAILIIAFEVVHASSESSGFYLYELGGVNLAAVCIVSDIYLNKNTWLAKALAIRWIVEIGVVSYGVYLWHYPIFKIMHDFGYNKSVSIFLIGGAISLVLAVVSYYLFEIPAQETLRKNRSRSVINSI